MTPGQTRVVVLLLVLAAMEAVLQPGIKTFLQSAWAAINTGINNGSTTQKGN